MQIKQADAAKTLVESQLKSEKDKVSKVEKEIEKIKTERLKYETKASALDVELAVRQAIYISNHLDSIAFFILEFQKDV